MTAQNKTVANDDSVESFVQNLPDARKREDSRLLIELMRKVSGHEPKMWGSSIIGFDSYHYVYPTGREGDMCVLGFSPRKENMAVYFIDGFDAYASQLKKLGKHKTAKSCLYFKALSEIDTAVLVDMLENSYKTVTTMHRKI